MEVDFSLEQNEKVREKLVNRLQKYGLEMTPNVKAEFHNERPQEMPQAYVVNVRESKNPARRYWVTIVSRGVFTIDTPSNWWKTKEKLQPLRIPKK